MPSMLANSALALATQGCSIFPLVPRRKIPFGGNGCKDATRDTEQIQKWWAENPQANIGLATGAISGIFVVDVDPRHGGDKTIADLVKFHGVLPRTVTVKTGGGGFHLYFRHVSGLRNSAGRVGTGVDIRADGGYVVAPPSIHENGKSYQWAQGLVLEDIPIAKAPAWLLDLLQIKAQKKEAGKDWPSIVAADVPEGGRNDMLARLCGYLLAKRVHSQAALDLLLCWNAARCKPPLDEEEVFRTVNSIAQREYEKRGGRP